MKQCPNCRNQIPEEAAFCPVCGTAINAFHSFPEPYPPQQQNSQTPPVYTPPVYTPPVPKVNPYDHTSRFDQADIARNKNWCMLPYLLDFFGIILLLLKKSDSEYASFHLNQAVKFTIVEALLGFAAALLCWTLLVPFAAAVLIVVVQVLKLISFLQVCKGKAVEPALIRSLKFLN